MTNSIKLVLLLFFGIHPSLHSSVKIDWEHPIASLTLDNGLPSTYIKKLVQDEFGFTWIASYAEISRYDGEDVVTLQDTLLPSQSITDIAYDHHRRLLWISSYDGIYSYDVIEDKVTIYHDSTNHASTQVNTLAIGSDRLWLGGRSGFAYLDIASKTFHKIELGSAWGTAESYKGAISIHDVEIDPDSQNKAWIGTSRGLFSYEVNNDQVVYHPVSTNVQQSSITNLSFDTDRRHIYISLSPKSASIVKAHVLQFDTKTLRVIDHYQLTTDWVNRGIGTLSEGVVLFTSNSSVISMNTHKEEIEHFIPDHLGTVKLELLDKNGMVWLSNRDGITCYPPVASSVITRYYDTPHENWYHVPSKLYESEDEERIYMSVFGAAGLYHFDLQTSDWHLIVSGVTCRYEARSDNETL